MELLPGSDLEIDKVLIWKTEIPFENKQRQSSYFRLMGLEWCLRFSYRRHDPKHISPHCRPSLVWVASEGVYRSVYIYHVITLHRVPDGWVPEELRNKKFGIKTCLMQPAVDIFEEIGATHTSVVVGKKETILWHIGEESDNSIFEKLPCLYNSSEVKVVCKFYGHAPSTFQLGCMNSCKLDKSVQVSSEVPMDFQTLSSDFSDLLEKEIIPDVKLECGGQTFQAHRSILAARSVVFQAMFQNKMLESETGTVKIHDIDASVLLMLLKFLYSGKSEDLSEDNTADLYEAADKYDVVSLKTACSYWMIRNLTEGNCINFLQVATSHSDINLKDATISYIIANPHVMMSTSWLSLSKEHKSLAIEVFQTYVSSTVGSRHHQLSAA